MFTLVSKFKPSGDQPKALKELVEGIKNGKKELKFIDLKSLNMNRSWSFLQLEHVIPALALWKMKRRMKRFYEEIKQPYPFEN